MRGFRRAGRPEHVERDAEGSDGVPVRGGFAPAPPSRLSGVTHEYTAQLLREAEEEHRRRRPETAPGASAGDRSPARAPGRRPEETT